MKASLNRADGLDRKVTDAEGKAVSAFIGVRGMSRSVSCTMLGNARPDWTQGCHSYRSTTTSSLPLPPLS